MTHDHRNGTPSHAPQDEREARSAAPRERFVRCDASQVPWHDRCISTARDGHRV